MHGPRRSPHRRLLEPVGPSVPFTSLAVVLVAGILLVGRSAWSADSTSPIDCSAGKEEADWIKKGTKSYPSAYPEEIVERVINAYTAPADACPDWQAVQPMLQTPMLSLKLASVEFKALTPEQKEAAARTRLKILDIVDYMLALPEEEVDIWKVSLTLAQDRYPDLDAKAYTDQFEAIVSSAAAMVPPTGEPDLRIRALNTFLYRDLGIEYDHDDLGVYSRTPTSLYIHNVVRRQKGVCGNLAEFYIAVAQRIGLPVYGVRLPNHLFARYVDPADPKVIQQNIEPTSGGGFISDADYVLQADLSTDTLMRGYYLSTLSYKELVAEQILNHAMSYYADEKKDWATTIEIVDRALDHTKGSPDALYTLGQIYNTWGDNQTDARLKETLYTRGLYLKLRGQMAGRLPPAEGSKLLRKLLSMNVRESGL